MSVFNYDLAERMKDPLFAYEYGRTERELEIIKLIRDRVTQAKEYGKTGRITAMQRDVSFEDLEAIAEAIIYGIEKESK